MLYFQNNPTDCQDDHQYVGEKAIELKSLLYS